MTSLVLAGDIMLGRGVSEALHQLHPEEPWGDFLPLLRDADARIVNLECALTRHRQRWRRGDKFFYFRADPEAVKVLRTAWIDACALANNHTLDFEEKGLLETLATLDSAGIHHAGAGADLEDAIRPAIIHAGPARIGLVAMTDNQPDFAATPAKPGTNYIRTEPRSLSRIAALVTQARAAGADLVVVSNHWGPNMRLRPTPAFRAFAHSVIDAGADVFYGHSSHLFQGIEIYQGHPILYDTGDFIDDYMIDPTLRNDWSFLFRLGFDGHITSLDLFPAKLSFAHVRQAQGADRAGIVARMELLCRDLGTTFVDEGDHLAVNLQGAPVHAAVEAQPMV